MSFSISQELRKTFHVHALRHEAKSLLTGRQWEAQQSLSKRCQKATDKEEYLFKERYDNRISQEYKKLMNERTAKTKEHKPGFRHDDLFDRSGLLKQADANVRNRHHQRLARIERIEKHSLENLLQRSSRENQLTGQSKDAFTRSADRRSGEERRSDHNNQTKSHRLMVHRQTR